MNMQRAKLYLTPGGRRILNIGPYKDILLFFTTRVYVKDLNFLTLAFLVSARPPPLLRRQTKNQFRGLWTLVYLFERMFDPNKHLIKIRLL